MFWWIIVIIVLLLISWVALRPIPLSTLESHPNPVTNYAQAVQCVRAMQEEDNQGLARDVCITKLFDHGSQTEHVIVLLHGFTNCPEQFAILGKQFYDAGFNVLIPRFPFHGLSDRLTDALVKLRAEDMCVFGDNMINIAHGLGKKVTVMGISGGGTLSAWLAQNRPDLDYSFPIAAFFALTKMPGWAMMLFERVGMALPNFFMWWDPRTKAENPHAIYYAYPRYPIRAMVEVFRLGTATQLQAKGHPLAAKTVSMVINDAEPSVNNDEIINLLETWQKHGTGNLRQIHFEKSLKLPHDFITPGTPGLNIEEVYARLIHAVEDIQATQHSIR
jgi:pimeloyl-ACP methyl ester carboxylesterase